MLRSVKLKQRTPITYGDANLTCTDNQGSNIAKHNIILDILEYSGWDVAFPDSVMSPVDLIAYKGDSCYKIQIKSLVINTTKSGYARLRVPLRNYLKYTYTKNGYFKGRSTAYRYFNNGVDCVAVYIKGINARGLLRDYQLPSPILWVWKTDVPMDATVFNIGLSMDKCSTRRKAFSYYGFESTRREYESQQSTRNAKSLELKLRSTITQVSHIW